MSRFLVAILLLAVVVLSLGFYLGWFQVSETSNDQKSNYTFTVDEDKIRQDGEKAREKVQDAGAKVKESSRSGAEKVKEETQRP